MVRFVYSIYSFHFLDTISEQLKEKLTKLGKTILSTVNLAELKKYQNENKMKKGVYLLYYQEEAVYIGKAGDVEERLKQHYYKLSGRKNIDLNKVYFSCIILDDSMSTAANEELLIKLFKQENKNMWNGSGFGPKDPGRKRDDTKPGEFDTKYPINDEWDLKFTAKSATVWFFLNSAKNDLPYVFRYEILEDHKQLNVDLSSEDIKVKGFLTEILNVLGSDYQANILSYGITLYRENKKYEYAQSLRQS